MAVYDFSTLSPYDFEILCRDLLSEHFKCRFESFAPGPDGGIDLRCFSSDKNETIVQCKRHSKYSSLKSGLKREKSKVEKLNPSRYLLATTVDLTRANKEEISKLFSPFILNEEDILGRQDINQLLADHPQVERNHFKLWLSSTTVLQRIINNGAYSKSESVMSEIKDRIKFYVQNQSYHKALEILKKQRVLVITGVPGIGKTTLAYVLIYNILANREAQFFALSNSISEGFDQFNEYQNQIFLFDDFLGRNFLQVALGTNEDDNLIKFIGRIRKSKNKILICTTREYILNQAVSKYEKFQDEHFELGRLTLDISAYTQFVKAEILYNHLFFSGIKMEFLKDIVLSKSYLKIIKHRNYNPRLIEFISLTFSKEDFKQQDIKRLIHDTLENPAAIWKHAFENDISKISQKLLFVLLACGDPILEEDLFSALSTFLIAANQPSQNFDEIEFHKCLKELENSFIMAELGADDKIIIKFHNPGIADFLIQYLNRLKETQQLLIKSAVFLNQLSTIFSFRRKLSRHSYLNHSTKPIELSQGQIVLIQRKILTEYDKLHFSNLTVTYSYNFERSYKNSITSEIDKLIVVLNIVKDILDEELKIFFSDRVESLIEDNKYLHFDTMKLMQLLYICNENEISVPTLSDLLIEILTDLSSIDEIVYFTNLESLLFDTFGSVYLNELQVKEKLLEVVNSEIRNNEDSDLESIINGLEELDGHFELDFTAVIEELKAKNYEEKYPDDDNFYDNWKDKKDPDTSEAAIHNMYISLLN